MEKSREGKEKPTSGCGISGSILASLKDKIQNFDHFDKKKVRKLKFMIKTFVTLKLFHYGGCLFFY